jgi:hypothetical protein
LAFQGAWTGAAVAVFSFAFYSLIPPPTLGVIINIPIDTPSGAAGYRIVWARSRSRSHKYLIASEKVFWVSRAGVELFIFFSA